VGTTDRAGHRLGVEASIQRILVFLKAFRTQREVFHAGLGPVVGKARDDRVTGTTVRTVGEGIVIAALSERIHFPGALRTGGEVRRNTGTSFGAIGALQNVEAFLAIFFYKSGNINSVNTRRSRLLIAKGDEEVVHAVLSSLNFDLHAVRPVPHPTQEFSFQGDAVHKGPEAHTLDYALDLDMKTGHQWCSIF
jgi:hypothetical protein